MTKFRWLVAWPICLLQLFVNQVVTSWILKFNLIFLINQSDFSTWPKSHDKNLNILRTKRAFKINQNAFFIIFKGLLMKQISQIFLESEIPTLIRFKKCNLCTTSLKLNVMLHFYAFSFFYIYKNKNHYWTT